MPTVFSRTRVQSVAGAKLYFYATGTSNPQNTYTDADLTTPHSNPVEADAEGYFDPIYLDPTLPDYRYILTDANDVPLEGPIDDVPAAADQSQGYRLKGASPTLYFEETDATTNNKKWRIRVDGEVLLADIGNDAESSWTNVFRINRLGGFADLNSDPYLAERTGSFTATLTGMSGSTTGTVFYTRIGGLMILYCANAITGTSNSPNMAMTGMPANILPKSTGETYGMCSGVIDDGDVVAGHFYLSKPVSTWRFDFSILANPPAAFTSSGTKGLSAGFLMMYYLASPGNYTP